MGHNHDEEDDHYYDNSYLHENQLIFLTHYLDMLEACDKGIQFVQAKIQNGEINQQMMKDCLDALHAMNDANFLAWNLMKTIDQETYNHIRSFEKTILPTLREVDDAFKKDSICDITEILIDNLYPTYLQWSSITQEKINSQIPNLSK